MGPLARRKHDEILRIGRPAPDVRTFALRAARALSAAVPFDGVCQLTIDPGTGVTTGEVVENGLPPAATRRLAEIESRAGDVNRFADLAASGRIAAGLSTTPVHGGAPAGSASRSTALRSPSVSAPASVATRRSSRGPKSGSPRPRRAVSYTHLRAHET